MPFIIPSKYFEPMNEVGLMLKRMQKQLTECNDMGDLKDARLIYLKGFLFLITGLLSAAGILVESPTMRTAFLLFIAIWSFCRLYYFLFYVIEKYVDGNYRFAGIYSFLMYVLHKRRSGS